LRIEDGTALGSRLQREHRHNEGLAYAPQLLGDFQVAQNAIAQFRFLSQLPQDVRRQNGANCMWLWSHDEVLLSIELLPLRNSLGFRVDKTRIRVNVLPHLWIGAYLRDVDVSSGRPNTVTPKINSRSRA